MKSDVKIKMIYGTLFEKHRILEEFKKDHRIIKTFDNGAVMIVKWSLSKQVNLDDVEEVEDGGFPF